MLSAAKHLAVETLRCAQNDMSGTVVSLRCQHSADLSGSS
jgi:hypothetical protein